MSAFLRCIALVSAVTIGAGIPAGPASIAQPKVIEVPQKRSKPQCVEFPPVLVGDFRQTLTYDVGGLKQIHVTKGRLTWRSQGTGMRATDTRVWPDVTIGSKGWRDYHAKARCPVHDYAIDEGELTVHTEETLESPLTTCHGTGMTPYDAKAVLQLTSTLYLADNGYLLTIGAPDTKLGKNTVTGECVDQRGRKTQYAPIDKQTSPNIIWILDRKGTFVYGVHGGIEPPIATPGRSMLSARWDFAAPSPSP